MRKVCGNIFEDRNVQLYLNVHRRFDGDLVKSSGYTIFVVVYAESFKSIGMFYSTLSLMTVTTILILLPEERSVYTQVFSFL